MADAKLTVGIQTDPKDPFSDLKQSIDRAQDRLDGFGKTIGTIGAAFASVKALKGTFDFVINASEQMEDLNKQFIQFTGSASSAAKQVQRIADLSAESPFELSELAEANKLLLQFGSSTSDSVKQLEMLGNVAAGTGADLAELAGIFGRIQFDGKLTATELEKLGKAGVSIAPQLAADLGVAESSIASLAKAGKISSEAVTTAFRKMTEEGGKFAGAMAEETRSVNGAMNALKNSATSIAASFGEILLPVLGDWADVLKGAASSLKGYVDESKRLDNDKIASEYAKVKDQLIDLGQEYAKLKAMQKEGFQFTGPGIDAPKVTAEIGRIEQAMKDLVERSKMLAASLDSKAISENLAEVAEQTKIAQTKANDAILAARQKIADDFAELDEQQAKEQADRYAAAQKQLTAIMIQEESTREALRVAMSQQFNEAQVAILQERLNELNVLHANAEAQRLEIINKGAEAETLRAESKHKTLTIAQDKAEKDRLAIIRKAQEDEFNFVKITADARKKFDEQTWAQRAQTAQAGLSALSSLMYLGSRDAFNIGKRASQAQILISIPEAAMKAYSSLAGIPLVGPSLGAAAAAAAVALGAAQLAKLEATRFAEGGMVPGVGNKDTVPALLTPGEVVVPKDKWSDLEASFGQGVASADQINLQRQTNDLLVRILEQLSFGIIVDKLTLQQATLEQIEQGISSIEVGSGIDSVKTTEENVKEINRNTPVTRSGRAAETKMTKVKGGSEL